MTIRGTVFAVFLLTLSFASTANQCDEEQKLKIQNEALVVVGGSTYRTLNPQFFGFNLELVEFQNSLWNGSSKQTENDVIQLLQRFPGAVYRYPGGTVANHFDWQAAIGPEHSRTPQQIVDYQEPRSIQFGPSEYLDFVKQVNGTAWYVLNLYGYLKSERTPQTLAQSAGKLAAYFESKKNEGLPAVYRWELGNELDRGRYRWPAYKYADVAKQVSISVRPYLGEARMVSMAQDWPHTGASTLGVDYNAFIATNLGDVATEFASHLYYDGAPWGPPLPRLLKQVCKNLNSIHTHTLDGAIWITEHGRAPMGTPADPGWKNNWPQTGSLAAAISTADMMLSLARTRNVKGAFMHSLHGSSGPWPLFHKRSDGVVYPSAVYWALVLLRESLLDNVLITTITTTNNNANEVGYDTNTLVMANARRSQYSVWSINRGEKFANTKFSISSLAGKKVVLKITTISSKDREDSNYSEQYKVFPIRKEISINVSTNGEFSLLTPAYSVTSVIIDVIASK